MKIYFLLFNLLISFSTVCAFEYDPKSYFGEDKGCFIIHELYTQYYFKVFNNNRNIRYSPASTFKIPHALIGLETGSIKDPNILIPRDGHHYCSKYWNQDQTLYSAIKYSVVPYFMKLAAKIGASNMRRYLKKFEYGNQYFINRKYPLTKGEQIFWLNNELKITANEQIVFLKKMHEGKLDVKNKNLKIVKDSLVQKKGILSNASGEKEFDLKWGPKAVLSAKTGATNDVGWLVGHIKTDDKEYVFVYLTTIGNRTFGEAVSAANQLLNDFYLNNHQ